MPHLDKAFLLHYLLAETKSSPRNQSAMKTILCAFAILLAMPLFAQQPSQEEVMKAMNAYRTPGDIHKMMASWDGTWECEYSMWMEPGKEPFKSKGTMTSKMLLDGRYNEMHYNGDFMGEPMKGVSVNAWDNAKKKFVNTWIDNFGTGIMQMEGPWDAATKTIQLYGKMTDPVSGGDTKVRQFVTMVDDNTQKMQMWVDYGGTEMKTMEMIMKRKK
jgi:hypothetical protein